MARVLAILAVSLCLPGAARAAEPLPAVVDVTPYAKSLAVFHDGKGHYFVAHLPLHELTTVAERLFYGDGKRFFRQPVGPRSRNQKDAYFSIVEPRVAGGAYSSFEYKKGKAAFRCESRLTSLERLEEKQAAAMIKAGRFHEVFFQRSPYILARDSNGRYFYVDRVVDYTRTPAEYRVGDFRVYSGMRGKMKPLKMKNVVSDRAGEIFITPDGQLKLIVDRTSDDKSKSAAFWIARGKKIELTLVEVESFRSLMMIFRDLGPYAGQRLERPCDDL